MRHVCHGNGVEPGQFIRNTWQMSQPSSSRRASKYSGQGVHIYKEGWVVFLTKLPLVIAAAKPEGKNDFSAFSLFGTIRDSSIPRCP